MTIVRTVCAFTLAAVVAGCEGFDTDFITNRPQVADVPVASRLESTIGASRVDAAPTAIGSLLEGYHGTAVGKSLVSGDRRFAEQVAKTSLENAPNDETSTWENPASGHSGTFTPLNSYQSDDRYRCRDYMQEVTADGDTRETRGTACQTGPNTWKVVEVPITRVRAGGDVRQRRR